jgi:hypothetical protein
MCRTTLGQEISIGASIGVVFAPKHGASAEELMKNVDLALYKAKSAGRGTYAFFEPGYDYAGGAHRSDCHRTNEGSCERIADVAVWADYRSRAPVR